VNLPPQAVPFGEPVDLRPLGLGELLDRASRGPLVFVESFHAAPAGPRVPPEERARVLEERCGVPRGELLAALAGLRRAQSLARPTPADFARLAATFARLEQAVLGARAAR
jgi:hypothetical protein